jgi:xylulokinase
VAVGGGTKSTTWLQIVSDAAAVPQIVPALTIGASYGDAFLAGLASGILKRKDLETWIKPGRTIEPSETAKSLYDRYYADYLLLYERTRDIVHRLGAQTAADSG